MLEKSLLNTPHRRASGGTGCGFPREPLIGASAPSIVSTAHKVACLYRAEVQYNSTKARRASPRRGRRWGRSAEGGGATKIAAGRPPSRDRGFTRLPAAIALSALATNPNQRWAQNKTIHLHPHSPFLPPTPGRRTKQSLGLLGHHPPTLLAPSRLLGAIKTSQRKPPRMPEGPFQDQKRREATTGYEWATPLIRGSQTRRYPWQLRTARRMALVRRRLNSGLQRAGEAGHTQPHRHT